MKDRMTPEELIQLTQMALPKEIFEISNRIHYSKWQAAERRAEVAEARIAAIETQLAALRADAAEAATILSDLAGDITAAFDREPWRDQPGLGYAEIQLDKVALSEYRALAARLAAKKGERG